MDGYDEYEDWEDDIQEVFLFMLENGYMEEVGYDHTGEPIYRMTPRMVQDFPDLFDAHLAATNEVIFGLWQKGMLEMNIGQDGEWTVMPTYSTFNYIDMDVDLNTEEVMMLEEIARIHTEKNI